MRQGSGESARAGGGGVHEGGRRYVLDEELVSSFSKEQELSIEASQRKQSDGTIRIQNSETIRCGSTGEESAELFSR